MKLLFDKIGITSKMYCTRVYKGIYSENIDTEVHMHCFILYFIGNDVYQLEHPNYNRARIYKYKDEATALCEINNYYMNMSGCLAGFVTEFF